jgi:hypothetical protein
VREFETRVLREIFGDEREREEINGKMEKIT